MKRFLIFIFIVCVALSSWSQEGFLFTTHQNKIVIPFQLMNNLIILPIEVNGIALNFILDTGSAETVLFSLEEKDSVSFNHVEKIKLKGFGSATYVDGLKSKNNQLICKGYRDNTHELYIVLDGNFTFSAQIGIPINGIIGYSFFKNNLIEIDYVAKKIKIYQNVKRIQKQIAKRFTTVPIEMEDDKPYFSTICKLENSTLKTKMLLDTGSSDGIWLFQKNIALNKLPNPNIQDCLGNGFSGPINGKRARIDALQLSKFMFTKPIVAFPDSISIANSIRVNNRHGSIGGELLKRFRLFLDYPNGLLHIKQNSNFDLPFEYNMSGLTIQNDGYKLVRDSVDVNVSKMGRVAFDINKEKTILFSYQLVVKPSFIISSIRENSPAAVCGLKTSDIIVSINNNQLYNETLDSISNLLKSEEGKTITIVVMRESKKLTFQFQLKKEL